MPAFRGRLARLLVHLGPNARGAQAVRSPRPYLLLHTSCLDEADWAAVESSDDVRDSNKPAKLPDKTMEFFFGHDPILTAQTS